jgi:hypothetical protein
MASVHYEEYKRMFPDAQDPFDLAVAIGLDGVRQLISQALKEKKRIVIECLEDTLGGMKYHLE